MYTNKTRIISRIAPYCACIRGMARKQPRTATKQSSSDSDASLKSYVINKVVPTASKASSSTLNPIILPRIARIKEFASLIRENVQVLAKKIAVKARKRIYCCYDDDLYLTETNNRLLWYQFPSIKNVIVPYDFMSRYCSRVLHRTIELDKSVESSLKLLEASHSNRASYFVVLLGHFNHGKTTLLDALGGTRIAEQESFGITQVSIIISISIEFDGTISVGNTDEIYTTYFRRKPSSFHHPDRHSRPGDLLQDEELWCICRRHRRVGCRRWWWRKQLTSITCLSEDDDFDRSADKQKRALEFSNHCASHSLLPSTKLIFFPSYRQCLEFLYDLCERMSTNRRQERLEKLEKDLRQFVLLEDKAILHISAKSEL